MKKIKIIIEGEYNKFENGESWYIEDISTNQEIDSKTMMFIIEDAIVSHYIENNLSLKELIHNIKASYKGYKKADKEFQKEMKRFENS